MACESNKFYFIKGDQFYRADVDAQGKRIASTDTLISVDEGAPCLVLLYLNHRLLSGDGKSPMGENEFAQEILGLVYDKLYDRYGANTDALRDAIRRTIGNHPAVVSAFYHGIHPEEAQAIWGPIEVGDAVQNETPPDQAATQPANLMVGTEATQGKGPVGSTGGGNATKLGGTAGGAAAGIVGGNPASEGTGSTPQNGGKSGADPVLLASGSFYHQAVDLETAGRGLNFRFMRTYMSRMLYKGPLGYGWDHCYNLWLREVQEIEPGGMLVNAVYRSTGELREDKYTQIISQPSGDLPPLSGFADALFAGPGGFFDRLERSGRRYILETPAGLRVEYGDNLFVTRIVDRNGNTLTFDYDGFLLTAVTDPVGKRFQFRYDALNRIVALRDETGNRDVRYFYGDNGDLEEVDLVLGPDCLMGTDYRYSGPDLPFALQHNLIEIIDAKGAAQVFTEYGVDPGSADYNRVARQRSADGEYRYAYDRVEESDVDPNVDPVNVPVAATAVTYPNGHVILHWFNPQGNVVRRTERVLSATGVIEPLVAIYRYNADGLLVSEQRPDGAVTEYHYEREAFVARRGNAESATAVERLTFGNLLRIVQMPRPGLGEVRNIVMEYTYLPGTTLASIQRGPFYADPLGRELAGQRINTVFYEFDARRNLVRSRTPPVTRADGTTQAVSECLSDYDVLGRQTTTVCGGRRDTFAYFDDVLRSGFLREQVADVGGVALRTAYDVDALGRVTRIHSPHGANTEFEYTPFDAPHTVRPAFAPGAARPEIRYSFDKNRRLVRAVETVLDSDGTLHPDGALAQAWRYDSYGRLIEQRIGPAARIDQPGGARAVRSVYNQASQIEREIDTLGRVTLWRYEERMLPVAVTRARGTAVETTRRVRYDRSGDAIAVTDGTGQVTQVGYDAFSRACRVVTPDGDIFESEHDAGGRVIRRRLRGPHPDTGALTLWSEAELQYDELGRVIESSDYLFVPGTVSDVSGATPVRTRYVYDALGRVERIMDAVGEAWRMTHDTLGRLVAAEGPDGTRTETRFDDAARTVSRTRVQRGADGTGQTVLLTEETRTRFNERGLLTEAVDSLGRACAYAYDSRGLRQQEIMPDGRAAQWQYDLFGQPVAVAGRLGAEMLEAATAYDAVGNVVRLQTPSGDVILQAYDALDRIVRVERGDGGARAYAYDAEGRCTMARDENGVVVRSHHTPGGLLASEEADLTGFVAPQESPGYLPAPVRARTFTHTPGGAPRAITDSQSEVRYAFDSLGRMLETTSNGLRVRYGYDLLGRRTRVRFPGGRELAYDYAASGLSAVRQVSVGADYPGDASQPAARRLLGFARAGASAVEIGFGDSHRARIHHSADGRAAATDWTRLADGASLRVERALYGSRGELRLLQADGVTRTFAYDDLYRLTSARDTSGVAALDAPAALAGNGAPAEGIAAALAAGAPAARLFAYALDRNGSRLHSLSANGASQETAYVRAADERYAAVGARAQVYDRAGNLLDDGERQYRYDAFGRLCEVNSLAGRIEVVRDALGRAWRWRMPDGEREVVFDGLQPIEWRLNGVPDAQSVPLGALHQIAHVASGNADWFPLIDAGGSVVGWLDPNGTPQARAEYDPYGNVLSRSGEWPAPFGFSGYWQDDISGICHLPARAYLPRDGRFLQRDRKGWIDGPNEYAYARNAPGTLTDALGFEAKINWGVAGLGISSKLLMGLALVTGLTALVRGGWMSKGAVRWIGLGIMGLAGLGGFVNRRNQALGVGEEDSVDMFLKSAILGIGDIFGLTSALELAAGENLATNKPLTSEEKTKAVENVGLAVFGVPIGMAGARLGNFLGLKFPRPAANVPTLSSGGPEVPSGSAPPPAEAPVAPTAPVTPAAPRAPHRLQESQPGQELPRLVLGSDDNISFASNLRMQSELGGTHVPAGNGPGSLSNASTAIYTAHGVIPENATAATGIAISFGNHKLQLSSKEFAGFLYYTLGWRGGTMRLHACGTGLYSNILRGGFAELVALELKVLGAPTKIIAPKGASSNATAPLGLPVVWPPGETQPLPTGQGWEYSKP